MDKRISRQYFNDYAEIWDEKTHNNDPIKLMALAKRLDLPCGGWILDVGTGTGVFLPYIRDSLKGNCHLISMDFAINMVSIAKRKHVGNDIQFICSEIETLHIGHEVFDTVICYSTFPHFHNKPLALENIYKHLKSGGRLYICHTSSRAYINQIHSKIPDLKDHLIPNDGEMKDLLFSSGFSEYEIASMEDSYLAAARK
jgi:ubiquinone/menaquinone biosynthesis C-methylase UbiE